jgi:hypothetical protein
VNGKTYLSYSTEKSTKRINQEIVKNIQSNIKKAKEEIKKDIKKVMKQQDGEHQSMVYDLKTYFKRAELKQKQEELIRKEILERTTCDVLQNFVLTAKNQCSTTDHLLHLVREEGPLESYFEVLNLKIEVSLRLNPSIENRKGQQRV